MDAQERAERSAAAMFANDQASPWMGMTAPKVGPGSATMSLTVEPHHCNGHYICHGAVIFGLADSAFAFACNSYNQLAVAQHNTITYLSPARAGDVLTAVASELHRQGRGAIYDVTVTSQDGTQIAAFRGASRTVKGQHFEE